MNILILQGPNLNLLGMREPHIYGVETLDQLHASIIEYGKKRGIQVETLQTNHEGDIIDALHSSPTVYAGVILNPGAYTHYSYGIRDAIAGINIPVVEVHLSNIYSREAFRHQSVIAPVVLGQITGLGTMGYRLALDYLEERLKEGGRGGDSN